MNNCPICHATFVDGICPCCGFKEKKTNSPILSKKDAGRFAARLLFVLLGNKDKDNK